MNTSGCDRQALPPPHTNTSEPNAPQTHTSCFGAGAIHQRRSRTTGSIRQRCSELVLAVRLPCISRHCPRISISIPELSLPLPASRLHRHSALKTRADSRLLWRTFHRPLLVHFPVLHCVRFCELRQSCVVFW